MSTLKSSNAELRTANFLFKAAGVMGLATLLSRILGFLRDCLIAAAYGTSLTAQAFVVAFRIPNTLRDLVGEGAANSALVPVFSSTRTLEGEDSFRRLAQAIWVRLLIGFGLLSILGILLAPWMVLLVAPGFLSQPELLELCTRLTRILFPFIGLVGLAAFFMGVLNSVHHFFLPSLGPALLNLSMIAGIFLLKPDALGLAWGVIFGGFLQLAIQWPTLKRFGVRLNLQFLHHPGVTQAGRLLIPRVIGTGVYQFSVVVDTIFASFGRLVGAGGVASLYFAHRFLHLPLALFGISMAQAALPTMASQAANQDLAAMRRTSLLALRSSLFIAVPSSIGLLFFGFPIIENLLERGAFSAQSTSQTVAVLQWYALGLIFMCAVKVLANTLYALQDTWTPVRSAAMALILNVILNLLLVRPMGLSGLALATSLSSAFNSLHLYTEVSRRIGLKTKELFQWFLKVLAASLGMGGISVGVWSLRFPWVGAPASLTSIVWLLFSISLGVVSFFLLGVLLRIEESKGFTRWLRRKQAAPWPSG